MAGWLNQTDFHPRVHLRSRKAKASRWSKDTVGEMLTNVFYLGFVKYKGNQLPGRHKAIVEQGVFEQVQAVRRKHRRGPSTYAKKHRTYLLSGLARSVHCGEKLSAHHISGHDYYQDTCKRRGLPCDHHGGYIRGDLLEEQVSMIVSTLTLPKSWRELVLDLLSSKEEVDQMDRERARLQEKVRRLQRQYREVEIDEDDYRRELELTRAKLATLVVPGHGEIVQLGDHVEGIVSAWQAATKEERRDLLRLMLDAVYVDMDTKEVSGLQPKQSFLPLFGLDEPVEAADLVLSTNLTPGGLDSGRGRQTDFSFDTLPISGRTAVVPHAA